MIYDGYVKYEEAEIHRPAIMQDFRNVKKKKKKKQTSSHFEFFSVKFVIHGSSLCETLHFVLYSWSSHFAFFELSKYYKIQNGR